MGKTTIYRNFTEATAERLVFLYGELTKPDLDKRRAQAYMHEFLSLTGWWPQTTSAQNFQLILRSLAGFMLAASVAYLIYRMAAPTKKEVTFEIIDKAKEENYEHIRNGSVDS